LCFSESTSYLLFHFVCAQLARQQSEFESERERTTRASAFTLSQAKAELEAQLAALKLSSSHEAAMLNAQASKRFDEYALQQEASLRALEERRQSETDALRVELEQTQQRWQEHNAAQLSELDQRRQQEVADLQAQLAAKEEEHLAAVAAAQAQYNTDLARLNSRLDLLQNELSHLEVQHETQSAELAESQRQHTATEEAKAAAQKRVEECEQKIQELFDSMREAQHQLTQQTELAAARQVEIERLMAELAAAEQRALDAEENTRQTQIQFEEQRESMNELQVCFRLFPITIFMKSITFELSCGWISSGSLERSA
jgi:chromosome segregation ATPase